jgi:hypothetical protein
MMNYPNDPAVRGHVHPEAVTEVKVRPQISYSVTQYIDPTRVRAGQGPTGSSEISRGLSLKQANDLARTWAQACPFAEVTQINHDLRVLTHEDAMREEGVSRMMWNRLKLHPVGSSCTFSFSGEAEQDRSMAIEWRIEERRRVEPDYTEMQAGDMLQAVGDDAVKWAKAFCQIIPGADEALMIAWFANAIEHSSDVRRWRKEMAVKDGQETSKLDFFELRVREVTQSKQALGELSYPVAAAIRRNAEIAGDMSMLELLDQANVAVDAGLNQRISPA